MGDLPGPTRIHGERLVTLRGERTQEEVCAAVGISPTYLSRLERQRHTSVTIEVVGALARFYGVSIDYLVGRTDKETLDPDCVGTDSITVWQCLLSVPVAETQQADSLPPVLPDW